MLVNDTNNNEILSLFNVEVIGGVIKVALKNSSTLTLTPKVDENGEVEYEKEYLTGKENKKIEKIQKKIRELEGQVSEIKVNGVDDNPDETQEENENGEINSEEKQSE